MLAASSGIDMRGVLRTLRPVGRDTSRDSGTRIRFLLGSAASSSTAGAALAVAWMAWASVWLIARSEEHTSELHSLIRNSYAVFCLQQKKITIQKLVDLQSTT